MCIMCLKRKYSQEERNCHKQLRHYFYCRRNYASTDRKQPGPFNETMMANLNRRQLYLKIISQNHNQWSMLIFYRLQNCNSCFKKIAISAPICAMQRKMVRTCARMTNIGPIRDICEDLYPKANLNSCDKLTENWDHLFTSISKTYF